MGNRRGNKVIRISPSQDDKSKFYAICTKPKHPGIIPEDVARQCSNCNSCEHLIIYRPQNYREKRRQDHK